MLITWNIVAISRKNAKQTTLSELAAKYRRINYHLVLHHIHLAAVVELEVRRVSI